MILTNVLLRQAFFFIKYHRVLVVIYPAGVFLGLKLLLFVFRLNMDFSQAFASALLAFALGLGVSEAGSSKLGSVGGDDAGAGGEVEGFGFDHVEQLLGDGLRLVLEVFQGRIVVRL